MFYLRVMGFLQTGIVKIFQKARLGRKLQWVSHLLSICYLWLLLAWAAGFRRRMRKPRTYEQILKMQMWFVKRKCVQDQLRNAKSLEDLLSVPQIMTEENMKAVDAYERSLLGADFRWPVEGDVYITVRDVFARSQVWLSCAGSSGGEGIIPAGTRITIGMSGVEKPLLIGALPDNPRELEGEFVSEISLNCGQYLNYNLVIGILEFRDGLRLVRPANQGSRLR